MRTKKRKKRRIKFFLTLIVIVAIVVVCYIYKDSLFKTPEEAFKNYVASSELTVPLYDEEYKESKKLIRGTEVEMYEKEYVNEDKKYKKVKYEDNFYMVNVENLVDKIEDVVKEKELYVRTNLTLYKEEDSSKINSFVKKGEKLDIIGYYDLKDDGSVTKYKVKYNDLEGYVYSKYLVKSEEDSKKPYSEEIQNFMYNMGDWLGGGNAASLDYYPYEKPKFKDNVMPDEVRAVYINGGVVSNIDAYIEFAKSSNINAFVIDIKDNTSPAYNSPVMQEYSPTNYSHAINDYETYKGYIKKAKEAGIYVIGRITTFKDSYFVNDHPEVAIKDYYGNSFNHNGSYWPTVYNRYVWEFNVELAKEAIKEVGFNEIQFDYVRFPDGTTYLENNGTINLNNTYGESKASVLQSFLMYACDEIHKVGGYVSVDVFGESASSYVTAYGQFWPAISNIVDVISGMPYPDHFNIHEYGISEAVWTVPYTLLNYWSQSVVEKQSVIATPAIVRTWIQVYNATRDPYTVYDANKVSQEIQALYDNGLKGGYMTWNGVSYLDKYYAVSDAFRKEY